MTATAPRWLQAYETKSGLPDPRHAGTTAKPHHCATCGRLVLAGYDNPLCAFLAIVDPYQLTQLLEVAAVMVDRPTYALLGHPGNYTLTPRTPTLLPGLILTPATQVVVVAAHHCGRPPLSTAPLPTREPRTAWTVDSDGPAPF